MPSLDHAVLVELFRRRPELGPRLLRTQLGLTLPRHARVEVREGVLDAPEGEEFRADLVLSCTDGLERVKFAVVLEAQRAPDNRKRYAWPVYLAMLRWKLKAPVLLLVVTPSARVVRWARAPIVLGGTALHLPSVIGPAETPRITDLAVARDWPELAVLSARMHGASPDGEPVLLAALEALTVVDPEMVRVYARFIDDTLPRNRPTCWRGPTMLRDEFKNVTLPKHFQQWEARGEARGKADALLSVLRARGWAPDEETRARIAACNDVQALDRWIARAVTEPTLDAVFAA